MFYQANRTQAAERAGKCRFCPWRPWPLTWPLTLWPFKLDRVRNFRLRVENTLHMFRSPQFKLETAAIASTSWPKNALIGYVEISQVTLVDARGVRTLGIFLTSYAADAISVAAISSHNTTLHELSSTAWTGDRSSKQVQFISVGAMWTSLYASH